MSVFYLYDDAIARGFEPFALSRPAGELRAGAWLIRERWEAFLGARCGGLIGALHLEDFTEEGAPAAFRASVVESGAILANARFAPALGAVAPAAQVLAGGGHVAALRLPAALPADRLADGALSLDALAGATGDAAVAEGWWLDAPWDLVRLLPDMLAADLPVIAGRLTAQDPAGFTVIGQHPVCIEQGARIEPMVLIDASAGPVVVRHGASVAAFTRLVGPCYVAPGAQLLGGKIGGASIGESCRVHGEMSQTILIGHANKGHDGFVGHSVLGRWVNLGAATVTSNLKNTYGQVQLWTPDGLRDTGMQFLGTLLGDHARTAIGTRLTTGSVIGMGANVVAGGIVPKVVAPFTWGDGDGVYDVGRFVGVAARVMARRQVTLDEGGRRHLHRAFAARWTASR